MVLRLRAVRLAPAVFPPLVAVLARFIVTKGLLPTTTNGVGIQMRVGRYCALLAAMPLSVRCKQLRRGGGAVRGGLGVMLRAVAGCSVSGLGGCARWSEFMRTCAIFLLSHQVRRRFAGGMVRVRCVCVAGWCRTGIGGVAAVAGSGVGGRCAPAAEGGGVKRAAAVMQVGVGEVINLTQVPFLQRSSP